MEFRPCIDIHNGKVKQIVGSTLLDCRDSAEENFTSAQDAAYYALMYRELGIRGGHVIMLNHPGSEYYEATRSQALSALRAYPGGLQIGGGITAENAAEYIRAGASHVIVTSYVFQAGWIQYGNLACLKSAVGASHIVLDLSCKKTADGYYIVTDRWQNLTREKITPSLLDTLSESCSEFLIHAVDVEGKSQGIEEELVILLGQWNRLPITYAGGVHNLEDLHKLSKLGGSALHVTIGSALDIFGGPLPIRDVLACLSEGCM